MTTPRTDAALVDAPELNHPHPELIELARDLKRDLAAAQEELAALKAELASVKAHAEAMYADLDTLRCGLGQTVSQFKSARDYRAAHPQEGAPMAPENCGLSKCPYCGSLDRPWHFTDCPIARGFTPGGGNTGDPPKEGA